MEILIAGIVIVVSVIALTLTHFKEEWLVNYLRHSRIAHDSVANTFCPKCGKQFDHTMEQKSGVFDRRTGKAAGHYIQRKCRNEKCGNSEESDLINIDHELTALRLLILLVVGTFLFLGIGFIYFWAAEAPHEEAEVSRPNLTEEAAAHLYPHVESSKAVSRRMFDSDHPPIVSTSIPGS